MIDILITCPRCGQFKTQGRDVTPGETAEHYTNTVVRIVAITAHGVKDLLCRESFKVEIYFPKGTPIGGIPCLTEPPEM